MVIVKHLCVVIVTIVQVSIAKPQDTDQATARSNTQDYDYDYGDYGKQYGDYVTKQYGDYGTKHYGDYGKHYDDYGTDYDKQYHDYVKQYSDYVKQYGDYGAQYGDYGPTTGDYGLYDHTWQYEDDFGAYDDGYTTDYGEYFVFGDRNSPLDTIVHVYDETGLQSQTPWVYIIVPVVQIDVLYVDPEHEKIEDIEMQFPIETFFFELGDFGMGHFDLGDFGLGDFGLNDFRHDYIAEEDYALTSTYGEYNDYPVYGNYQGVKAGLYDTADQLGDLETLDYPGIDHDPYWIDWIFMIPPDEMAPGLR